jgi:hypothetical protein
MATALVQGAYIRSSRDLKRRDTCDPPKCGTANRSGGCIGLLRLGGRLWQVRSKRFASCSGKWLKGNNHAPEFTRDFASSPYSCCPAVCRAALRRSSRPEADHGVCRGRRPAAPVRGSLVLLGHAAPAAQPASSRCPCSKSSAVGMKGRRREMLLT